MSTIKSRYLIILFVLFAAPCLYAQRNFSSLGVKWNDYLHKQREDMTFLHHRYFKNTIGVEEMKEAFRKYKGAEPQKSLYEGFDSVTFPTEGNSSGVMMVSPLKRHPDMKVRVFRGVWTYFGYRLIDLVDKNGVSNKKLLEKLKGEEMRQWIDGEILVLEEPRWYMGFAVSPRVYWHIYEEGRLLAEFGCSSASKSDFFSYAALTNLGWGGRYWDSRLQEGARMLGTMCGLEHLALKGEEERTFSVLLYQKPTSGGGYLDSPYTIEMLEPENADEETQRLFKSLKIYVESLPNKTFNPYYTTDFRIMNGRYYRVTVNKCGWLVEDYMKN